MSTYLVAMVVGELEYIEGSNYLKLLKNY